MRNNPITCKVRGSGQPLLFEIEKIQFHIKEVGGSMVIKPDTGIDLIKESGPGFYGLI
jgi:hypothetical protein